MEILITLLIIAVIWLFIKSSNNNNNINRVNDDVETFLARIDFLQGKVNGLEKAREEQCHKNHELRKQLTDLQSAQILNKSHIFNKNSVAESAYSDLSNNKPHYDINDINDLSVLKNKLSTIKKPEELKNEPLISQILNTTIPLTGMDNPKNNSFKLDLLESDKTLESQLSNPDFPTFIHKDQHRNELPLPYSFDFSQFLLQKRQVQQAQEIQKHQQTQVHPTLSAQEKVQQAKPQSQAIKLRIPSKPPEPSLFDKAFDFAKNWLTTGNIPVKIGMLVIIAAVIALLRLATNMGLIHVPIHIKLLGVAVSAMGALAFAWLKRHSKRSFSLSVQGGSIGIILLTIFSAVKMYPLISPTVGFVASISMVLLTAVLSIQQNAKILALMAIFAGFLAPIWLSDGSGSHVMLFSYYAILNVGIFIVAMFRPWRELNVLGFVFTYFIGSTWGGLNYTPEQFSTIEPFVILFFFFYLLIPLRYAQQANQLLEERLGNNDDDKDNNEFYKKYKLNSGLLFGAPLVTLVAQVVLLDNNIHLALSCVGMGLVYGILAFMLRGYSNACNENHEDSMFATLQKTYAGLSASFLTLAVPIGMSAKATTTIFALEGAGAIWLGAKSNPQRRRTLTWLAGGFLQLSSAIAFVKAYSGSGYGLHGKHADAMPIFNEFYISGILLAVAGLLCAWFSFNAVRNFELNAHDSSDNSNDNSSDNSNDKSTDPASSSNESDQSEKVDEIIGINAWLTNDTLINFARLFFLWGIAWWIGINIFEITRVMDTNSIEVMYGWMIFITATAVVLPIVYNHRKGYHDGIVWVIASLLIMAGGAVTLIQWLNVVIGDNDISLVSSTLSWSLFAVGGWLVWRGLQTVRSSLIDWSVVVWFLALTLTVSTVVYQLIPHSWQRQSGWHWGIIFAVWIVIAILDTFRPQALAWLANRPTSLNKKFKKGDKSSDKASNKETANIWQTVVSWIVVIVLAGVFAITTLLSGSDGWWLPVLNSLDGLQVGLAFLILAWCVRHEFFTKVFVAYAVGLAMVISMSVRMANHWADWQGNIQNISDWHWLMIFGFWTVLGFGLWALLTNSFINDSLTSDSLDNDSLTKKLTNKLSAISERIPDVTLEVFQIFFNSIMLVLIAVWCVALIQLGEVSPWLPLFNPLELLQWSILGLLLLWTNGSNWQDKLLDHSTKLLIAYAVCSAMVVSMTVRMMEHWVNWHGNIQNLSDWNWLTIFGLWTVLGFGLWALLTGKLSSISERLSDMTLALLQVLLNSIMLFLMLVWSAVLFWSGEVSPWIPLLNPLAILQWSILALLLLWANGSDWQEEVFDRAKRSLILACLILVLISVMTLRFVYHFYQIESISWGISMFSTAIIQMALTIIWSILGVVGWIVGSRRQSKPIWLMGAVFMVVVLIKLLLIDIGHLGTWFGIGSFLAYGLLCVIVGYFAPIPSFTENSLEEEANDESEEDH